MHTCALVFRLWLYLWGKFTSMVWIRTWWVCWSPSELSTVLWSWACLQVVGTLSCLLGHTEIISGAALAWSLSSSKRHIKSMTLTYASLSFHVVFSKVPVWLIVGSDQLWSNLTRVLGGGDSWYILSLWIVLKRYSLIHSKWRGGPDWNSNRMRSIWKHYTIHDDCFSSKIVGPVLEDTQGNLMSYIWNV